MGALGLTGIRFDQNIDTAWSQEQSDLVADLRIQGQSPDIRLHKLQGDGKGYWSVTVKLPWCITFKFKEGEFSQVRIENYHRG